MKQITFLNREISYGEAPKFIVFFFGDGSLWLAHSTKIKIKNGINFFVTEHPFSKFLGLPSGKKFTRKKSLNYLILFELIFNKTYDIICYEGKSLKVNWPSGSKD
jgi:hypothetical protein